MSNNKKFRLGVTAGATVLTVGAVYAVSGAVAQAAAPDSLAVFLASSTATPVGVISRVPAQTDGGMILSSTLVQLGKSQAQAAGGTLGPLGDAFVVTSSPPGTITQFPSVVTAQYPPSETAPREASLTGGRGGGVGVGEVRNVDLNAMASDFPEASANASGNAVFGGVFNTGASVSRSVSSVLADGTVTTEAFTAMQNVVVGAAAAPLTIGQVTSLASIVIKPGAKPVSVLEVRFSGAQLAGVPVIIDANGIRISDQVALPPSSIQAVNSALAGMAAQGITVSVTPPTTTEKSGGVDLAGSALSIRYKLPDSPIPKPSDIGTDETFEIGQVKASSTARTREPLVGAEGASGFPAAPAAGTDSTGVDGLAADPSGGALPVGAPAAGLPATDLTVQSPGTAVAAPVGFVLPARAGTLAPDQARDAYRILLLGAILAFAGLVAIVRKRSLV